MVLKLVYVTSLIMQDYFLTHHFMKQILAVETVSTLLTADIMNNSSGYRLRLSVSFSCGLFLLTINF